MSGIVLLGLGPGGPGQITREALDILASAPEIWVRSRNDPAVANLQVSADIRELDEAGWSGDVPVSTGENRAERLLQLARRSEGVVFAVSGHPLLDHRIGTEIMRRGTAEGLDVRIVVGVSLLDATTATAGIGALDRLSLCDATALNEAHLPPFPPDVPALVLNLDSPDIIARTTRVLKAIYPEEHRVKLVHAARASGLLIEDLALSQVEGSQQIGPLTALYVPPLDPGSSLESLQEVVAHLRAPEGCPWDREQTHLSLRPHLLEEAYEAIAALDSQDPVAICEELGDLLLQIMLNAQIASEAGGFTINDVSRGIYDKLKRRHPHVFGDLKVEGVEGVLANWERLKEGERDKKGASGSLLEGVPLALPALGQAQQYQERAARVGFDWPEVQGVLDKIAEEIGEVRGAGDGEALASELGDLLFALVNLSRWKGVDAESALRAANARFRKRFGYVEAEARRHQQRLSEMTLDQMDALWEQAKSAGL